MLPPFDEIPQNNMNSILWVTEFKKTKWEENTNKFDLLRNPKVLLYLKDPIIQHMIQDPEHY